MSEPDLNLNVKLKVKFDRIPRLNYLAIPFDPFVQREAVNINIIINNR